MIDRWLDVPVVDPASVETWRLEQLLDAGYPVELAERLARRTDIDLHQAIDLVAAGCKPELAERILL